ncbi:hypothetical protein QQ045_031209 [Rhodiola kirilowii]
MMRQLLVIPLLILLFSSTHFNGISASRHQDIRLLKVGEELWKETLPLQMGSALYELHGLEPLKWYEVKISYPASVCVLISHILLHNVLFLFMCLCNARVSTTWQIPASFSLRLIRDASDFGLPRLRKLLNTEKLIFQNDNSTNEGPLYALVTVMPEGVVAIPNAKEREFIIFNIVCDELLFGIPYKAWWVGALVMLCLALALMVPHYLPPFLLQSNLATTGQQAVKIS